MIDYQSALNKWIKCIKVFRDFKETVCSVCYPSAWCRRLIFSCSFHLAFPSTILCPYLRFAILSVFLSLFVPPFSAPFLGRPVSQGGVFGHIQQWANAKLSKHEARTNDSCVFYLCVRGPIFAPLSVFTLWNGRATFFPISNGFETVNNITRRGSSLKTYIAFPAR